MKRKVATHRQKYACKCDILVDEFGAPVSAGCACSTSRRINGFAGEEQRAANETEQSGGGRETEGKRAKNGSRSAMVITRTAGCSRRPMKNNENLAGG